MVDVFGICGDVWCACCYKKTAGVEKPPAAVCSPDPSVRPAIVPGRDFCSFLFCGGRSHRWRGFGEPPDHILRIILIRILLLLRWQLHYYRGQLLPRFFTHIASLKDHDHKPDACSRPALTVTNQRERESTERYFHCLIREIV